MACIPVSEILNPDLETVSGGESSDGLADLYITISDSIEPSHDGTDSPGGLQFIDGETYAVEGMTVHNSDLVWSDMSLVPVLDTVAAPIDGIANISWRSL